jgi:hypothetical protein
MKLGQILWWLAFAASLALLAASLPGYWTDIHSGDLSAEFSVVQQAALWFGALFSIGCTVLCLGLAVLVSVKKPNDRMAVYLSYYLLMFGILLAGPIEALLSFWFPSLRDLAINLQTVIFPVPSLILFLIFPTGHFAPRWTRWLVVVEFLLTLYSLTFFNDLTSPDSANQQAVQLLYFAWGFFLLVSLAVQINRYRNVSTPAERQQTKWVLYGFGLSYLLLAVVSIPYYIVQNLPGDVPLPWWVALNGVGWWLGLAIQPIGFTVAILRTRLWDIDVIVRRTVLYTAVTLMLALVYFASVILLHYVFFGLTGVAENQIVTVVSTLAIAALFVPLRNRMQKAIDQQFNRNKYNAQQVLQKFSATVRDETDLNKLTEELVKVVNETMQPKSVSVWLSHRTRFVPGERDD